MRNGICFLRKTKKLNLAVEKNLKKYDTLINMKLGSPNIDNSTDVKITSKYDKLGVTNEYEKLGNDWRAVNQIIWQIPTAAIAITTGIIIAAYQQYLLGLPRIFILIIGSLLLFSLAIESVKKRLHMDAIGVTIDEIETIAGEREKEIKNKTTEDKMPGFVMTHFSDTEAYNYIKSKNENYNGDKDFLLRLFKVSHARQALTHVTFYAGVAVSILAILEIIAQYNHTKLEASNSMWIAGLIGIGMCFVCEAAFFVRGKKHRAKGKATKPIREDLFFGKRV